MRLCFSSRIAERLRIANYPCQALRLNACKVLMERRNFRRATLHRLRASQSQITSHRISEGKCSVFGFKAGERYHVDSIPRAAFQERTIGPFAGAKLATNAKQGINNNSSKRRMVLIEGPKHAICNGTILDAGGRPRTPRAIFIDHGKNVRLAFALVRLTRRDRRLLDHSSRRIFLNTGRGICQCHPPRINFAKVYCC
jgi:hypothetical protein